MTRAGIGWTVGMFLSIGCSSSPSTTGHDGGPSCLPGGSCVPPNICQLGTFVCSGGAAVCQETGQPDPSQEGKSCGTGLVCKSGSCASGCAAGTACPSSNKCDLGSIACNAGVASCVDTGTPDPSAEGKFCGYPLNYCQTGACSPCPSGNSCTVTTPCYLGSIACDPTLGLTCQDAGPAPDGTPCSGGLGGVVCTNGTCGPFVPASHAPFPQYPNQGGALITQPDVVTITFKDYPFRSSVEAFGAWVVNSPWLSAVGPEYGIQTGGLASNVELSMNAPASATDDEIASFLLQAIDAGVVPGPQDAGNNPIYVLYYPATTTLYFQGYQDCGLYAYHYSASTGDGGVNVAIALVADCFSGSFDELGQIEVSSSHEIFESSTDPFDIATPPSVGYNITDQLNPWSYDSELADPCANLSVQYDGGFTAQRIWSNRLADAGVGDPCAPVPPGEIYINVSSSPIGPQTVAAGSSFDFTIKGWSTAQHAPWYLGTFGTGDFSPTSLINGSSGVETINNGVTSVVTVGVPVGTPSGSHGFVLVGSYPDQNPNPPVGFWPLEVVVQ
jgi:hypothetical protein